MCYNCIEHQGKTLPAKGSWVPCFKMKDLKGDPFLVQIVGDMEMRLRLTTPKPTTPNCTGCGRKIIDLLSTEKIADPWRVYTPRTDWR